jgi:hypothetical protein
MENDACASCSPLAKTGNDQVGVKTLRERHSAWENEERGVFQCRSRRSMTSPQFDRTTEQSRGRARRSRGEKEVVSLSRPPLTVLEACRANEDSTVWCYNRNGAVERKMATTSGVYG